MHPCWHFHSINAFPKFHIHSANIYRGSRPYTWAQCSLISDWTFRMCLLTCTSHHYKASIFKIFSTYEQGESKGPSSSSTSAQCHHHHRLHLLWSQAPQVPVSSCCLLTSLLPAKLRTVLPHTPPPRPEKPGPLEVGRNADHFPRVKKRLRNSDSIICRWFWFL